MKKKTLLKSFRSKESYGSAYDYVKLYECENVFVIEMKYISMEKAKSYKYEDLDKAVLKFMQIVSFLLS